MTNTARRHMLKLSLLTAGAGVATRNKFSVLEHWSGICAPRAMYHSPKTTPVRTTLI